MAVGHGASAQAGHRLIGSLAVQLGYSYYWCLRSGLAPGHIRPRLVGSLLKYGLSQLAANTPTSRASIIPTGASPMFM